MPGWGTQPVTVLSSYEFSQYEHLLRYPADGTYISNVGDGRVYRVAGGAPEYVTSGRVVAVAGMGHTADYRSRRTSSAATSICVRIPPTAPSLSGTATSIASQAERPSMSPTGPLLAVLSL